MKDDAANRMVAGIATIHAKVLAAVLALVFGVGIFVMTAWLVIKGGPDSGAHLQLLGQYFVGYSVTWVGSFVGLFYGLLVGGAIGWSVGAIYNRIAAR